MASGSVLGEISNQQWPNRCSGKKYGKKRGLTAQERAVHLNLFGGDENQIHSKMEMLTLEEQVTEPIKTTPGILRPSRSISHKESPASSTKETNSLQGESHQNCSQLDVSQKIQDPVIAKCNTSPQYSIQDCILDLERRDNPRKQVCSNPKPAKSSEVLRKRKPQKASRKAQRESCEAGAFLTPIPQKSSGDDRSSIPTVQQSGYKTQQPSDFAVPTNQQRSLQGATERELRRTSRAASRYTQKPDSEKQPTRHTRKNRNQLQNPEPFSQSDVNYEMGGVCSKLANIVTREANPRGRKKTTTVRKGVKLSKKQIVALEPILSLTQGEVRGFDDFGESLGKKYTCSKLGEGSYGDVYALDPFITDFRRPQDARAGLVIKVIAFDIKKQGPYDLASMEEVIREIKTLQALDSIHGFTRFRGAHVVHGRYPKNFRLAFDYFKTARESEAFNEEPPGNTFYAILEMDNAGEPISRVSPSAFQAWDIFWMTAMALAQAERDLEFEHRDLHNSNICIKPRVPNGHLDVSDETLKAMDDLPVASLGMSNLEVSIIDFNVARAKLGDAPTDIVFDPITHWDTDNTTIPIKASDRLQYDTYRRVRDYAKTIESQTMALAALEGVEYEEVDKYARYLPKTNVMWLGYVAADLGLRGKEKQSDRAGSKAAEQMQHRIWLTLKEVSAFIQETSPALLPESAEALVELAIENSWLEEADLKSYKCIVED